MMILFKQSATLARRTKPRQFQSFSESVLMDNIEAAETLTKKWISPASSSSSSSSACSVSSIFSVDNRVEGRRLIEVINSLQYAIQGVKLVNPESQNLTRAYNLVTMAMKHLEKEFYRILKTNRQNLDPSSVPSRSFNSTKKVFVYSDVPKSEDANVVTDLKLIADCMISSGYETECARIYKKMRKSVIVEALNKLGFENLSSGKVQKQEWETMEKNVKNWLEAIKIAIGSLFDCERILCDHIFSPSVSLAESCFSEITVDNALTLFIFPVSVARCRKSVEKIFLTLDVYQAISQLLPRIEEIFSYDSTSAVRFQAADSLSNLAKAINLMVMDFKASITKESSKSQIPGGGVHQLTRYVMNFIVFLADYEESLAGILTESNLPLPEGYFVEENAGESGQSSSSSPVTTRFTWLILVLLCKIDTKSRIYNDMALSYLFLANNLHYVVSKVRTSNLRVVLGEEWVANHEGRVSQYLEKYEKIAWGEAMTSLSDTGDDASLEENAAKERLKRFNRRFEKAYKKHSTWVVPDSKLREDLKDSVSKKLTNVATSFYTKYHVETWGDIVKFAPEEFCNYLSSLYLGNGDARINVRSLKPSDSGRSLQSSESGR